MNKFNKCLFEFSQIQEILHEIMDEDLLDLIISLHYINSSNLYSSDLSLDSFRIKNKSFIFTFTKID